MWDIKYRPTTLAEVVGNETVKKILLYRSMNNTLDNRSLMFGGTKGSGKTTIARIMARILVCQVRTNGDPCNVCESCVSVLGGSHPGVIEFDAATSGTVDRIREIIDDSNYESIDGSPKILILDEAHRLSVPAQDALLTSMEDRKFVVIMCTTEPHKIRPALRDRLDEFAIRPPKSAELIERLKFVLKSENAHASEEDIYNIVELSDCSPRLALNAIYAISRIGQINSNTVDEYFRNGSLKLVKLAMSNLSTDINVSLKSLDSAISMEGPFWVRDQILNIILATVRASVGAPYKPIYRINVINEDMDIIRRVGEYVASLDKPNMASILLSILNVQKTEIRNDVIQDSGTPPVVQVPDNSMNLLKRIAPHKVPDSTPVYRNKVCAPLEIDGVKFNEEERITNLHDKIEPTKRSPGHLSDLDNRAKVEYDKSRVPMTDQEFARAFFDRFR